MLPVGMLVEYRVIDGMGHIVLVVVPVARQGIRAPTNTNGWGAFRTQPGECSLEPRLPVAVREAIEQGHLDAEFVQWGEVFWERRVQCKTPGIEVGSPQQ